MPPTLLSLIESNNRLADATLGQSHAINKLAESFDRLRPSFEQLRRDIYDLKTNAPIDEANRNSELRRIGENEVKVLRSVDEKLSLILDTVRTSENDLKQVARDVTSPGFRVEKESQIERVITRFEKLSVTTKILVLIAMLVAAASGWLTHLFAG